MNKRRLKLWARSPTIIILGLFLLAALHYSLKYPMAYSESQTLVYAKQYADPGFLPGDWYLSQYQPTRIPYQVFVYPLVQTMPLQDVSLWARLLGYLVAAAGLGLIGHRLRLPAPYIWIALGLFIFLDQAAIPGREWIFRRAESKVIAYGLVLFAVRALMDRRIATAGMLGGLATTMHILVGFWASVALGLTILAERLGSWRARVVAGLSWCMGAAYAFYAVFVRLGEPSASAGFDVSVIWNDFRNPHYTDISRWPWDEPRALLLWFLCVAPWSASRSCIRHASNFGSCRGSPFLRSYRSKPRCCWRRHLSGRRSHTICPSEWPTRSYRCSVYWLLCLPRSATWSSRAPGHS